VAATRKKKVSTRAQAARKGWETRRAKERALEAKRRAAAKKRAETLRRKAEAHAKRVEAAKRGARTRKAKERAAAALGTFVKAVDRRTREHELSRVKESWHRAKRDLESALDGDYERYLAILDELADDEGIEWDIAYGSTDNAA
jgi:hypothetical protein